jgi:uncharacterized protein YjiS (DUF1127 family)
MAYQNRLLAAVTAGLAPGRRALRRQDAGPAPQLKLLAGSAARIASWLRGSPGYKRSWAALRALDDGILKDIGIGRHEIDHIVSHGRRWS